MTPCHPAPANRDIISADLRLGDDQRRAEGDHVAAHHTQYQTMLLRPPHQIRTQRHFGSNARVIPGQLNGADQPTPRITDQRVPCKRPLQSTWKAGVIARTCSTICRSS